MNGGALYFLGKLLSCQLLQGKEVDRAGGRWGDAAVQSPFTLCDKRTLKRCPGHTGRNACDLPAWEWKEGFHS